jgi:low affinity Fe/Cu permease
MGITESKTISEVVNSAIANIIVNTSVITTGSVDSTQIQKISGVGVGSTYTQDATVDLKSLQNFKMTADIAEKMAEAIKQKSDAEGGFLQSTYSTSISNLANYLESNIKNDTVQKCATSLISKQLQEVGGFQAFVTAEQKASVAVDCVQSALNDSSIAQDIVVDVDQESTAEAGSLLGSLFGDSWQIIIIGGIAIVIAIIVAIVLIKLLRKKQTNQSGGGKRMNSRILKTHKKQRKHKKYKKHTKNNKQMK